MPVRVQGLARPHLRPGLPRRTEIPRPRRPDHRRRVRIRTRAPARLLDDVGNVFRVFDVGAPALLAPTRLDLIFVDRMQLGATIIDPATGRDFTVVGTDDPPLPSWYRSSTPTAVSDYSFGRAAPSGDYKVLRFHVTWSWYGRGKRCEVATIVMDDNAAGAEPTWRRRPLGPFSEAKASCLFSCEHKATVNGVLYFMIDNTYSASDGRKRIAAFDLEIEEWKQIKHQRPTVGAHERGGQMAHYHN